MKNLITIGCSLTKDNYQKTWAIFLAEQINYTLINLGTRGAGMDFLSKRAIIELEKHSPDQSLVVIMLPSSDRFDFYVDSDHPLQRDFLKTSSWQDGKHPSLVELDGSFNQTQGYCLTGGQARGQKKYFYKYYHNNTLSTVNHWFNFISLQNYLKLKQFSYIFTSAYDLHSTVEQPYNKNTDYKQTVDLFQLIDWSHYAGYDKDKGFLTFCKDYKFNLINHYPDSQAHKQFVEQIILPVLKTIC
jgi:hypothetical protein